MKKNNKIKRKKAINFLNKIKIKFFSFNFIDLTILIAIAIFIFSMFIPWFSLPYNGTLTQGIFSKINGIIGFFSIILILLNLFILFSKQTKEKIKMFFNQKITDNNIFLFSSIFFLIFGLNSLITIKGLQILNKDIIYHSGLTFYLIASILFFGAVVLKTRKKEESILISINESKKINSSGITKDNIPNNKTNTTKLPF